MFNDVGKKIKGFVKWATILLSVLLPLIGIIFIAVGDDLDVLGWLMIPAPILLIIPAIFLYGFGEIVDTAIWLREGQGTVPQKAATPTKTKANAPKKPTQVVEQAPKAPTKPAAPEIDTTPYIGKKICSGCGKLLPADATVCPECDCKYLGVITKSNAAGIVANLKDGHSANC